MASSAARRKVILDTDPGVDDVLAIFMAFQSPELEVIGLTTIFGNVSTSLATNNALYLCEIGGHSHVPVAEGSHKPLKGECPPSADDIHGADGLGNTLLARPSKKKIEQIASDFLVEKVNEFPGEVTIVAIGPLTNLAQAIQKSATFAKNIGQLIVMGGAFFTSGNVTPVAEANIYADPGAADIVFTAPGINAIVLGINVTNQILLTEEDLIEISGRKGRHGQYVFDICQVYRKWHLLDGANGIFLHDPACLAALLNPSLFSFRRGTVRVETLGICTGYTALDLGLTKWDDENPWTNQPTVDVGWTVDVNGVRESVKDILSRP